MPDFLDKVNELSDGSHERRRFITASTALILALDLGARVKDAIAKPPRRERPKPPENKQSPECRKEMSLEIQRDSLTRILGLIAKVAPINDSHYPYQVKRGPLNIEIGRYSGEGEFAHIFVTDTKENATYLLTYDLTAAGSEDAKITMKPDDGGNTDVSISKHKLDAERTQIKITMPEMLCKLQPLIEKEAEHPRQMKVVSPQIKLRGRPIPTEKWVSETLPKGTVFNVLYTTMQGEYGYPDTGIEWARVYIKDDDAVIPAWVAVKNKKGERFLEEIPQPR